MSQQLIDEVMVANGVPSSVGVGLSTPPDTAVPLTQVETVPSALQEKIDAMVLRFTQYGLTEIEAQKRAKHILGVVSVVMTHDDEVNEYIIHKVLQRALSENIVPKNESEKLSVYFRTYLQQYVDVSAADKVRVVLKELGKFLRGEISLEPEKKVGVNQKEVAVAPQVKTTPEGPPVNAAMAKEAERNIKRRKAREEKSRVMTFEDVPAAETSEIVDSDGNILAGILENENLELSPFEQYVTDHRTSDVDDKVQPDVEHVEITAPKDVHIQDKYKETIEDIAGDAQDSIFRLYDTGSENKIIEENEVVPVPAASVVENVSPVVTPVVDKPVSINSNTHLDDVLSLNADAESNKSDVKNSTVGVQPSETLEENLSTKPGGFSSLLSGMFTKKDVGFVAPEDSSGIMDSPLSSVQTADTDIIENPITPNQKKQKAATLANQKQSKDFFEEYIDKQIVQIRKYLTSATSVEQDKILSEMKSYFKTSIDQDGISISEKIALLDAQFLVYKEKYEFFASEAPIVKTDAEIMESILASARRDVHTGSSERDTRFQATLKNALEQKLKFMRAAGAGLAEIDDSMNHEYDMMKKFYTSTSNSAIPSV